MSRAAIRRQISSLARRCEIHCKEAEKCRASGSVGAALAHAMCAADCAQLAQRLAAELVA